MLPLFIPSEFEHVFMVQIIYIASMADIDEIKINKGQGLPVHWEIKQMIASHS